MAKAVDMDLVQVIRVAKIIALVGFLLPWVTYSCAGQPVATLSGFDLAIGQFTIHNTANGSIEHHSVAPDIWLIAALIVIVLGLLGGFIVRGSNALKVMLASSLGALALCLGGMQVAHNRDQQQSSANSMQQLDQATLAAVQIDDQYGFYITMLALAGAAGASAFSIAVSRGRTPSA